MNNSIFMDAYEILKATDLNKDISEQEYDNLLKSYANSFFSDRNYTKRLEVHRNPIELKNELLQEVYEALTKIQWREELKYVETKGDRTISGYVHTQIKDIWTADNRIPNLYHAIIEFCKRSKRNFTVTAIHVAEFIALGNVAESIQRSIYNPNSTNGTDVSAKNKGKKVRVRIPKENKIRAELQKEIGSICPFCINDDVGHFVIHHINEDPSENDIKNLLLLCPNCHSKITKGDIPREQVILKKHELQQKIARDLPSSKAGTQIHTSVANLISGGINTINIRQSKKVTKSEYPPGCIGYDLYKANYIDYLIDRYEKNKLWELKEAMRYGVFRKELKIKFKITKARKLNHLPLERFEELSHYIKSKVDNTQLGRINKGKGYRNYESLDEHKVNSLGKSAKNN